MEQSSELVAQDVRATCANCGTNLLGEYCFQCGQKRIPPDHLSLRRFVHEAVVHVGDFEHTKIFRTLRALLVRPGLLTTEYIAGKRADWVTPLKIFGSVLISRQASFRAISSARISFTVSGTITLPLRLKKFSHSRIASLE
ncbi:hypothetical protein BH18VER1_BH18VER1_07900 [soil metagenome]